MTFASTLSDEALILLLQSQADLCLEVSQMPLQARQQGKDKGGASPEQAACMNVIFLMLSMREAVKRGIWTDPDGFLEMLSV